MELLKRIPRKSLASECRHYVTIEERANVSDGEGGFTENWTTVSGYGSVPAAILPIRAQQKLEYRSINVNATHYIKFRGEITLVESENRISFDSRVFEILTVENFQERDILNFCVCKERRD